jgi:uncharacterized membrane protein YdjX (TVP38/TMEM64 family)
MGGSTCFFLSKFVGEGILSKQAPEKFEWLKQKVQDNKDNLLFYMLSLRLNPLMPNLLVNLSVGTLGVPYYIFLISSAIGAVPFNLIWVQAGMKLNELDNLKVIDTPMVISMICLAD